MLEMKPFNCVQKKLKPVLKCYRQNVFRNYIFDMYKQELALYLMINMP